MKGISHILHPTDLSTTSQEALDRAIELARENGGTLTLLHAYGDLVPDPEIGTMFDPRPELEEKVQLMAGKISGIEVKTVIHSGPPAETILWYAQTHKIDLIVMGTHGRTGLKHFFLGSVAEKVVRSAPCAVLTFRPQSDHEPIFEEPVGDVSIPVAPM